MAARAAAVSAAILELGRKAEPEANLRAEVESAEAERAKTLTPERVELEADGDWCGGLAAETAKAQAKASTQPAAPPVVLVSSCRRPPRPQVSWHPTAATPAQGTSGACAGLRCLRAKLRGQRALRWAGCAPCALRRAHSEALWVGLSL